MLGNFLTCIKIEFCVYYSILLILQNLGILVYFKRKINFFEHGNTPFCHVCWEVQLCSFLNS